MFVICFVVTEEFLLDDVSRYTYMTHGNVPVPGMEDSELYKQLLDAFEVMNISKDESDSELPWLQSNLQWL